jgi:hypothetical protein
VYGNLLQKNWRQKFVFVCSAVVAIGALPDKLNPVIKPLMEAVKKETNAEILTIVAKKLVIVDISKFDFKTNPYFTIEILSVTL